MEAVQKLGFLNNAIIEPPEKANFYRRTGMKIVERLNKQDWDGAIAKCTGTIDRSTKKGKLPSYDIYMNRGYARCFVPSQNDNYQEAVDDLSMAITLVPDDVSRKIECLAKRAYAYWLGGRYDSAIADCKEAMALVDPSFVGFIGKVKALADKAWETAAMAQDIAGSTDPAAYKKLETEAGKLETEAEELKAEAAKTIKDTNVLDQAIQDIADSANKVVGSAKNQAEDKTKEAAEKLKEAVAKAGVIVPYLPFVRELLGNIYSALDYPCEAVEQYKIALSDNQFSPGLLDKYREACEKLNRRR
jgi:tetratricopeptide (TPR) repeat protein